MSKDYFNEWRKATKGEDPTTSESEAEEEGDESEEESLSDKDKPTQFDNTVTLMQTVPDIATVLNYQDTFSGQNPLLTQTTNNDD